VKDRSGALLTFTPCDMCAIGEVLQTRKVAQQVLTHPPGLGNSYNALAAAPVRTEVLFAAYGLLDLARTLVVRRGRLA
jgi:hypothetical protein